MFSNDLQSLSPKISRLWGNLITPSRTRPPVGARLVVPTHWRSLCRIEQRIRIILLNYMKLIRRLLYIETPSVRIIGAHQTRPAGRRARGPRAPHLHLHPVTWAATTGGPPRGPPPAPRQQCTADRGIGGVRDRRRPASPIPMRNGECNSESNAEQAVLTANSHEPFTFSAER